MTTTSTTQNFALQNFESHGLGIIPPDLNNSINVANELSGTPKIFINKKLKTAFVGFNETPVERRFRRLKNKLKANIELFYSFTTFTIDDVHLDKFDSNKEIHRIMNNLQMYAKRHPPYEKLAYAWRVEFGKLNNRIHYHVFLSRYIPIKILYSIWRNGYIDIKKIDSRKKALNYITKYFSKDLKPVHKDWKQSNRLFGTSIGMKKYVSSWEFDKNEKLRYVGLCPIIKNRWDFDHAIDRCSKIIANLNMEPTYRLLSKKE